MKKHIAIVDDHNLFADGLERILLDESAFEIVAKCNSAEEMKTKLNEISPHLILLDIRMSGQSGIDFCTEIKKKIPSTKIILVSMFESADIIEQARLAGADGYLPKSTDATLVKSTIQDVLNGNKVFIKPAVYSDNTERDKLSRREREIINLIKKGMNAREIAETLFISQFTVETHRKNILKKLGFNSQKELIVYAIENQL